jgi:signal transduction histidine kinase
MLNVNVENEELRRKVGILEEENKKMKEIVKQVKKEEVEYLQNVAHQLVAPLNAIKWHIENLTTSRLWVDRAKKVLSSIYSQATLAVHLAKNFNLLSNLEADRDLSQLKEPIEEIELKRLLVNLANDFQPLAWDKKVHISVDDDDFDEKPNIFAMKSLISQVFSNIIENAYKYSNPNTSIMISGKYIKESDSFAVFIKDIGIPLPAEQTENIFNRGFRTDDAKNKHPAGTGFGLYIAKRIVEIHEGNIRAYNDKGQAVFEVQLSIKGLIGKARLREQKNRSINR